MDAGTLRVILIVLGAFLLGALYLWERRRIETEAEPEERPEERRHERPDERPERAWRREPSFGTRSSADAGDDVGSAEDASEADQPARASHYAEVEGAPHLVDAPATATDIGSDEVVNGSALAADRQQAEPTEAGASSGPRERRTSGSSDHKDGLLVQLFVVARGDHFDGSEVQAVAERQHLTPGEMDIYHRRNLDSSSQRVLFSMANLINPGTFPFDAMDDFTTPGVALFAQLEGLPSDLMVYDELVQSARSMADALGGDLLLPDRRPFDIDAWEGHRIELLRLINQRAEAM